MGLFASFFPWALALYIYLSLFFLRRLCHCGITVFNGVSFVWRSRADQWRSIGRSGERREKEHVITRYKITCYVVRGEAPCGRWYTEGGRECLLCGFYECLAVRAPRASTLFKEHLCVYLCVCMCVYVLCVYGPAPGLLKSCLNALRAIR